MGLVLICDNECDNDPVATKKECHVAITPGTKTHFHFWLVQSSSVCLK